jgi:hypothetical protein
VIRTTARLALMTVAAPTGTLRAQPDTSAWRLRVGPSFQSHSDLLASPFRQHGIGLALGLEYRRGGLRMDLAGDAAGTSSALLGEDRGTEDVWNGGLAVAYVRSAGDVRGVTLRAGGGLAALAFVRRHHYGPAASRDVFADVVVPLSLVGEAATDVGASTGLRNRAEAGIVSLLFRSPFAGTKTQSLPEAGVAAPWDLVVVRNHLTLVRTLSASLRLTLGHGLTIYATDRSRRVRLLRQDVSVGLEWVPGRDEP